MSFIDIFMRTEKNNIECQLLILVYCIIIERKNNNVNKLFSGFAASYECCFLPKKN